ncbi:hypothetical protein GG344DRAFT_79301 [Lentinula edodes]|nr:hypothetical protein GG344DRAFT_79301 [Lentinula edodes]
MQSSSAPLNDPDSTNKHAVNTPEWFESVLKSASSLSELRPLQLKYSLEMNQGKDVFSGDEQDIDAVAVGRKLSSYLHPPRFTVAALTFGSCSEFTSTIYVNQLVFTNIPVASQLSDRLPIINGNVLITLQDKTLEGISFGPEIEGGGRNYGLWEISDYQEKPKHDLLAKFLKEPGSQPFGEVKALRMMGLLVASGMIRDPHPDNELASFLCERERKESNGHSNQPI